MAFADSKSKQRTGSSSMLDKSLGLGSGEFSGVAIEPILTTWEKISIPATCLRKARATDPSATRIAVSLAEARSRIGLASLKSYFCIPTRSACPGRGLVSGAFRASSDNSLSATGSADIIFSHLGHSLFATSIAIGPPWVRPWRTPPRIRSSSASNFCRAPRPKPSRRRAKSALISSEVMRI